MKVFFITVGIICILYCLGTFAFGGYGTMFFLIWAVAGVAAILWGLYGKKILETMPLWIKRCFLIFVAMCVTIFVAVEGMVVSGFFAKAPADLDYIIVLGAQLKENGPSYVLRLRLDEAYEYLVENENTKVIVSGGQGANEPDTEAQGMYDYLVAKGIDPARIIKEDKSTDTSENILFSKEIINSEIDSVGIVSNNFHIFRAVQLAKAAGFEEVYGIGARSNLWYLPNNMLREFFGVAKDFVMGNL